MLSARIASSDDIGEEVLHAAEVVQAADEQDDRRRDREPDHAPRTTIVPSSAQREKSITHVIGFSPASQRRFSGIEVVGYATGVRNSHAWIRNGTTYCTSR